MLSSKSGVLALEVKKRFLGRLFRSFISLLPEQSVSKQKAMVLQEASLGEYPIYYGGPSDRPAVIVIQVLFWQAIGM